MEFKQYLPSDTSSAVVQPLGDDGVLVAGSDTQRGFGPLDQVKTMYAAGALHKAVLLAIVRACAAGLGCFGLLEASSMVNSFEGCSHAGVVGIFGTEAGHKPWRVCQATTRAGSADAIESQLIHKALLCS